MQMQVILSVLFYKKILHFLETHLLDCPSRKYFHMACPGCGFQRSFVALMRGDFINSFVLYPATVPIMVLAVFLVLHLKNQYAKGALILRGIYLFCAVVIAVNYTYKIVTHQIILS